MLLAVVHANGAYFPFEDVNYLPEEMPPRYHEDLGELVGRHLGADQPIVYLPYWIDSHKLGIYDDPELKRKAFAADPFLRSLSGVSLRRLKIIPDGPELQVPITFWGLRDLSSDIIAHGDRVCFVGTYAGACVLDRAKKTKFIMASLGAPDAEMIIDPAYCVDISTRPLRRQALGGIRIDSYDS